MEERDGAREESQATCMAAPPSLSKMSMSSIPTQGSSNSFVSAADFHKKFSSHSVLASEVNSGTAAAQLRGVVQLGDQIQQRRAWTEGEATSHEIRQKLFSYEEILRRKEAGEALIIVDGNVYDVAEFLETHPGGAELILEHLESEGVPEARPLMRGKVDEDGHSHSKAAFSMLEQFFIGSVKAAPGAVQSEAREGKKYRYTVDLTKPIVAQVGYLGEDYDQWVHDPIISKESPRFFESDFHEVAYGMQSL